MKSLVLFFTLSFLTASAQADVTVDWANYPGGVSIAVDGSDNIYSVNWDYSPGGDITLTRWNAAGSIVWQVSYNNTDNSRHEVATWVDTDSEGNILISGTIRSGYSNPVNAASLLMKYNPAGTLLWRRVYENDFDGYSTKKCLVDAQNNIYVLGLGPSDVGLVTKVKKFNPNGDSIWTYFDNAGIGAPQNFKFTPDNKIVISYRAIIGNINGYSKIDLEGNSLWSLAGVNSLTSGDAAGDSSGNTYVIHGDYGNPNGGSVIKKLSPTGDLIWERNNTMSGYRVEVGFDQNPVISGFPTSGVGAAFMKYNSYGAELWQNLDADGPSYAFLAHGQMKLDGQDAAYLVASIMSAMAVCKVNSDGSSAWAATMPTGYANVLDFGTDNSVYVVGGTTARLIQDGVNYLTEGFDFWFPAGWTSDTTNANYTWYQTLGNIHDGIAAAELYNDPALVPQDEWLISPTLDFSNAGANLSLSFWFMTSYYWHVNPNDNADLEVLVSTDNGSSWSPPLWTEDDYGVFANWTWYQQTLNLLAYVGQPTVKIAFRYVGSDGAQLTLDEIRVTDSSQGSGHDVGPLLIVSPGGSGPARVPFTPQITFRNFGTNTESFGVSLTITLHGSEVYAETDSIAGLAPGSSSTLTFPSYTPAEEGIYAITAATILVGDQNTANDSLSFEYNTMPAGGVIYDFEDGDNGFISDGDWQHGAPTTGPGNAHSGVNVFGTLINGQYIVGPLLSTLTSPVIQLGSHAILSFWHWYAAEESYDGGNVKLSTDGGVSWNLITPAVGYDFPLSIEYGNPIGGEMAFTGSGMSWSHETFDLSMYDGESVMIRFDFGSDNAVVVGDGWYIDDVSFEFLSTDIGDVAELLPSEFSLEQNYPNPFNAQTVIRYSLPGQSLVSIDVFDILGRKIETLDEGMEPAGEHQVIWDGSGKSSGIYFYRIKAGDKIETKKMMLLK